MDEYNYRISWLAPSHDHHEHTADWFWAVGIVSVSLAIAFVIVGNMLLSLIIIIGMGTLLYYAKHEPKNIEYEFSRKGIRAGETLYPWETLESFWILDGHRIGKYECAPKLLIISKKPLMPQIVILLNEFILEEVHQSLSQMLHEEYQVEPLPQRLMRRFGF